MVEGQTARLFVAWAHRTHYVSIMTRSEARAAGLLYYDEGLRPCPKGHFPIKKLVSNGACLACQREHATGYRKTRPDACKKAKLTYKAKHPERVLQQARETYWRTKEAFSERHRRWLQKNPERSRGYEAKRRALKAGGNGQYTPEDVARLLELQNGRCIYCSRTIRRKFHVDHIVALSKGGSNSASNIQLLCPPCNHRKFTRSHLDFARSRGLLL